MRCPLCDGAVVNGRCKDCGMPYRKDEALYHLNESRSDHYRHASDKAREIMREQQNPAMRSQQKQQGTPKKMTGTAKKTAEKRATAERTVEKRITTKKSSGKVKKHSRFVWIWIILILLALLTPVFENFQDVVEDVGDVVSSHSGSDSSYTDTTDLDTYFSAEQDDEGYMFYSLAAGNDPLTAGKEIETGKYGIYTLDEEATVVITAKDGTDREHHVLTAGSETLLVTLNEGDTIRVQAEDPNVCIYMMEWVN